jgi:diguanylate cyclase (GGDEF)-like protein
MVCDLDRFKDVNDRFGHNAGNKVLKAFAEGLTKIRRDYDVIARFGGDEFVLVLPDVKADSAGDQILALGTLATEVGRMVCGESILSSSVGVATWPEDGLTADELLAEADRRMYTCKNRRKQKRPIGHMVEEPAAVVVH